MVTRRQCQTANGETFEMVDGIARGMVFWATVTPNQTVGSEQRPLQPGDRGEDRCRTCQVTSAVRRGRSLARCAMPSTRTSWGSGWAPQRSLDQPERSLRPVRT